MDQRPSSPARTLLLAALGTLVVAASAVVAWEQLAPSLIDAVYRDARFGPLHELLQRHARGDADYRTPAYYVRNGRTVLDRVLIVAVGLEILWWALVFRERTWALLRGYFGAVASPFNLAVFRIVLFVVLLFKVGDTDTALFSALPAALRMPPLGLQWIAGIVPIDDGVSVILRRLFLVTCTAAILGLFSRTSALLTLILAGYALAVPQMFGSMNSDHHLFWFAGLLAASRCGDVLSLDAVRAAWKDADRGTVDPPPPARAYALPLRIVWLLMGIVYFFPGFWKLWRAGLGWVSSENLRHHMLLKWTEFQDWTPLVRLDGYPLLLFLGALGTVLFELSFVFLVLFPRGRVIAAIGGLTFHNVTWLTLNISFLVLQPMYLSLVDWAAAFGRLGRRLWVRPMRVVYDGDCGRCRRTIAIVRRFDVLGRVTYESGMATDLHAVVGDDRVRRGFDAYRALAARVPILWPVYPLLRLLHRHTADHRVCTLPARATAAPRSQPGFVPAAVVGAFLLLVNVGFGAAYVHHAWPFMCFPTFSWIAEPEATRLALEVTHADGHVDTLDLRSLNARRPRHLGPERLQGLVIAILAEAPTQREVRLQALWAHLAGEAADLRGVRAVRFYRDHVTTLPDHRHDPPLRHELVHELVLEPPWAAARLIAD